MSVNPTMVQVSAVIGAIVGLVQWTLATYVFPAGVPGPVESAVIIIVPAVCTGAVAWMTRSHVKKQVTSSPPAETGK